MSALFQIDWPYYTLKDDGYLWGDDGARFSDRQFESEDAAEAYLIANDYRGSVVCRESA